MTNTGYCFRLAQTENIWDFQRFAHYADRSGQRKISAITSNYSMLSGESLFMAATSKWR